MIIPIKCVSCGNVLANKYRYYLEQVRKKKKENGDKAERVIYYTKDMKNTQTAEAEVLDDLGLTNMCCRRIMLTHVDVP